MAGIQGEPSPGPSDLQPPVPNSAFNDGPDTSAIPKESAFSTGPEQSPTGASPEQNTIGKVLDATGRVLDYPGGFMRAGLASAAGLASGQGAIVKPEDLAAAAVGKGPNAAEYLRRLGVSEGGSMNLPGFGRVTVRGAEGLALDIGTDPLTAVAKLAREIPYIKTLLNAPGKAADALGEAIYKSAVSGADAKLAAKGTVEAGEKPIGDALITAGAPVGNAATLAQKVSDISDAMGKVRQGLYDRFNELGGKIGMPSDMFKRSMGVINDMRNTPPLRGLADELEAMVKSYQGEGFVSMEQMSKWKTQLYDSLPKGAFNGPALTNPGKAFKAALAGDFKAGIVEAGNKVESGLGDAIDHLNNKWGPLIDAQPGMQKAAQQGGGSLGKSIDAATLAATGLKGIAVKKAYELATSPLAKTIAGKALMAAGRNGLATGAVNRAFINSQSGATPPNDPEQGQGQ